MKNPSKLKVMALVLLSVFLVFAVHAGAALADSALGIEGPCYPVISPTASSSAMAVTWWDTVEVTAAEVRYSATINFSPANEAEYATAVAKTTKHDVANGYKSFEALMTGLEPDTTYYYRVGSEGAWSGQASFTTPPADPAGVNFMYLGDIQYSSYPNMKNDYQAWENLVRMARDRNPDLDFALMGGDMVDQGMSASNWQVFLQHASPIFSGLPMLAIPGNHESNSLSGKPELFIQYLAMPANGPGGFIEEFYSYDLGDCHIVGLSSNIFSNEQVLKGSMTENDFGRLAQWLSDDLAASDAKWKIVVMHHPAYVVVSDAVAAGVLANWEPIFAKAQVDLALCGHQHIYMRTKAIKGVTYVMGNSGAKHYAPENVTYSAKMIADTSTYQIIDTNSQYLTLKTYDAAGNLLDSVQLAAKDRSVTPVWRDNDLDGDGSITEVDVALLLNAIINCLPYDSEMDWNNDGKVDICDAQIMWRHLD